MTASLLSFPFGVMHPRFLPTYKYQQQIRDIILIGYHQISTKNMTENTILITFVYFAIPSIVFGHFIRSNDNNDLFMSKIQFDLNDPKFHDNVTYYSYHIHVYFQQQNSEQRKEAILLRNRFLAEFKTNDCHDSCDTWCPRICHWGLNMSPIGPHRIGSWGVYIPLEQFTRTVSFISIYHGNLSVLVHPNSGRPKIDHLLNAFWIKSILPLNKNQLSDYASPPSHPRIFN